MQIREKNTKLEDANKELKIIKQSHDLKIEDLNGLITLKENSLQESFELVTEKEIEIQRFLKQVREAEEAIKEYRAKYSSMEE